MTVVTKFVCAATLLAMIVVFPTAAWAGDVVEVRVVETKSAAKSADAPADLPTAVPKDAKALASIEALADAAGGAFRAKCVVDGKEVRLRGSLGAAREGKRLVKVEFVRRDASGTQQLSTNVLLAAEEERVIGGMVADGDGVARLVVLSIKHAE
jgi:hypothetical protein